MTFTADEITGLLGEYRSKDHRTGAAAVWIVLPDGEAVAIEDITAEPSDHESGLSFLIRAAAPEPDAGNSRPARETSGEQETS